MTNLPDFRDFNRGVMDAVKECYLFVERNPKWWIPQVASNLLSRWDYVNEIMKLSADENVTNNHFWYYGLFKTMAHPAFIFEKNKQLTEFTKITNRLLVSDADAGRETQGFQIIALRDTIGSTSRNKLLTRDYKSSFKWVTKIEEVGREGILYNTNTASKARYWYLRKLNEVETFFEIEKGMASLTEGNLSDATNHLETALEYVKKARWYAVLNPIVTFLASAYRLRRRTDTARELTKKHMTFSFNKGIQPRRSVTRFLELAKLTSDERVKLKCIEFAEKVAIANELNERVLLANIYWEKSMAQARLGRRDLAERALARAELYVMRTIDEHRLIMN